MTRQAAVLLAATALLAFTVAMFALPATAAGETGVRLVPETSQLSVTETTAVEVVVTNADGGVGAYNATVSVDADHATITNASVGDAGLKRVEVADDGSSASLVVALKDTAEEGPVTIATLIIEGAAAGTDNLSLTVDELGDEQGRRYQVADVTGASVTVAGQSTIAAAGGDEAGGREEAPEVSAEANEATGPIERLQNMIAVPLLVVGFVILVVALRRR